jgi:hypothetical protein
MEWLGRGRPFKFSLHGAQEYDGLYDMYALTGNLQALDILTV